VRYIPDLIPEKSRIEFSHSEQPKEKKKTGLIYGLLVLFGSILLLIGFISIFTRFYVGLLSLIIGFSLLPYGHDKIEKALSFKFKRIIKSGFISILFIFLVISNVHYDELEAKKAEIERIAKVKQLALEKQRKERIAKYLSNGFLYYKQKKYNLSIKEFSEYLKSDPSNQKVIYHRGMGYFYTNHPKLAIEDLTSVITGNSKDVKALYIRALCYLKTKKKQEAVNDLKTAMDLGDKKSKYLYNRINPIIVSYGSYYSRCCDGTTSSSFGRGTCSHHGGVCGQGRYVYRSRKY